MLHMEPGPEKTLSAMLVATSVVRWWGGSPGRKIGGKKLHMEAGWSLVIDQGEAQAGGWW